MLSKDGYNGYVHYLKLSVHVEEENNSGSSDNTHKIGVTLFMRSPKFQTEFFYCENILLPENP